MSIRVHQKTHMRWLIRRDVAEVIDIDGEWTESDLMRHLRSRSCIGMVAEADEAACRIVAFMIYELNPDRIDLIRFAVHPAWRLRGIGSQMAEKLICKLSSHRRKEVRCVVNERDLSMLLFLKRMGFVAQAIERDWYDDWDGIVMTYRIPEVFGGFDE